MRLVLAFTTTTLLLFGTLSIMDCIISKRHSGISLESSPRAINSTQTFSMYYSSLTKSTKSTPPVFGSYSETRGVSSRSASTQKVSPASRTVLFQPSSLVSSTYSTSFNSSSDSYVIESKPIVSLTGTEYIERLFIRLQRTRSWTLGIAEGGNCTYGGQRCSLGLYCKSTNLGLGCTSGCSCQIIHLRNIVDVVNTMTVVSSNSNKSGAICDPNNSMSCADGLVCKKSSSSTYYCVEVTSMPVPSSTVRNYIFPRVRQLLDFYSLNLTFLCSERAAEIVTEVFENSALKGGEYDLRGVSVLLERLSTWSMALPKSEREKVQEILNQIRTRHNLTHRTISA